MNKCCGCNISLGVKNSQSWALHLQVLFHISMLKLTQVFQMCTRRKFIMNVKVLFFVTCPVCPILFPSIDALPVINLIRSYPDISGPIRDY